MYSLTCVEFIDNSSSSSSSSSNAKMRWFRTQHTEAPRLLSLSPLRTDADENPEVASPRLLAVSKLRDVCIHLLFTEFGSCEWISNLSGNI
ncbi:hypothetical protein TKK_0003886 [Trichogramma kaykai]